MPSEDYGSVSRGALKIKGVEGSKIEKHKKKQKPKREKKAKLEDPKSDESKLPGSAEKQQKLLDDALADEDENDQQDIGPGSAMTDAERHSYERRYKMLEQRLLKEGVKSHKERVESLNRYLSTLSEHHDMPRIGPG